jgi:hypothetical protein
MQEAISNDVNFFISLTKNFLFYFFNKFLFPELPKDGKHYR